MFAPRGTPIRSATRGIVFEISDRFTGGRGVMVLGAYAFDPESCRHRAFDPLPLMVDRVQLVTP